jgi:hypothetical protein
MVDNTPDGPPVPIQALQVGSVYSPLSDRIDDNGNRGIGFLFIVKKRLSKRALQILVLNQALLSLFRVYQQKDRVVRMRPSKQTLSENRREYPV